MMVSDRTKSECMGECVARGTIKGAEDKEIRNVVSGFLFGSDVLRTS